MFPELICKTSLIRVLVYERRQIYVSCLLILPKSSTIKPQEFEQQHSLNFNAQFTTHNV